MADVTTDLTKEDRERFAEWCERWIEYFEGSEAKERIDAVKAFKMVRNALHLNIPQKYLRQPTEPEASDD